MSPPCLSAPPSGSFFFSATSTFTLSSFARSIRFPPKPAGTPHIVPRLCRSSPFPRRSSHPFLEFVNYRPSLRPRRLLPFFIRFQRALPHRLAMALQSAIVPAPNTLLSHSSKLGCCSDSFCAAVCWKGGGGDGVIIGGGRHRCPL